MQLVSNSVLHLYLFIPGCCSDNVYSIKKVLKSSVINQSWVGYVVDLFFASSEKLSSISLFLRVNKALL